MADAMAIASAPASSEIAMSQRRSNWSDATTRALIRVWEDHLTALRSSTRNARIYAKILEEVNAGLPHGETPYNMKQLRLKMHNLSKRYRSKWPYYWLLHSLLGSLPMNDEFLVEENIEVPEVRELPEGGQVIGCWEDSAAFEADGDVAASEPAETLTASRDAIHDETSSPLCSMDGPAGDLNTSKSKLATGRKRPATVVQSILASHKEEMVYVGAEVLLRTTKFPGGMSKQNDRQKRVLQLSKLSAPAPSTFVVSVHFFQFSKDGKLLSTPLLKRCLINGKCCPKFDVCLLRVVGGSHEGHRTGRTGPHSNHTHTQTT
ncbi:hypothetical protein HPB49_006951 [Dermacentor silvarum]|uniref:Uncharacterized protein n=1 Tax=Dermacentor silvarum TaxID=543639 RepID=A0ACB8D3J5_DERSI|nr:hypothetical protein HPB49_006951 [Dermacentor silvarum]